MAGVSYTSGALTDTGDTSEEISKLKAEIRHYFIEIDCNFRVLGSQLGLKASELNDLDRLSELTRTDFKELLLEKCFEKEKITSWHQFVTVLEKPALDQRQITKEIRNKFLRQYSFESDSSSLASPMSVQTPDSRSLEASFSSRMEIETGEITLPDAVNAITLKVASTDLHGLGINLGLDPIKVQDALTLYGPGERRQRLMELWFNQGDEPLTWEKLREALPSCEHNRRLTSSFQGMNSQGNPDMLLCSPTASMSMMDSNMQEIKCRFSALLNNVRSALEEKGVKFENVRQHLIVMFQDLDSSSATNFDELFQGMTLKGHWSFQNHSPVEKLISSFLKEHASLMIDYDHYVEYLNGFFATIKLIPYIDLSVEGGSNLLPLQSYTNEHYKKLKVKLDMPYRKITELSLAYVQDIWKSFAREFDIPFLTAIIGHLLSGSLEIVWLIQPYLCDQIAASAYKSIQFFREHHIVYVAIDDHPIYDAKLMVIDGQAATAQDNACRGKALMSEGVISPEDSSSCEETPVILMDTSPTSPKDVTSLITEFDRRFTELLTRTKEELCCLKKSVDTVYILLKTLSGREFNKYVLRLRNGPPGNFNELFDDLNAYCWNCCYFEHELLEAIIKRNNCSTALRRDMERYAHDIREFKRHTTVSNLIKQRRSFLKRRSPLKGYKKLQTRHDIDPEEFTISTVVNHFQQEVLNKSKCPIHFCTIEFGSVVVEWRYLEEYEHTLVFFFCDDVGRTLLEQYHISNIFINDTQIDHSLLLLTAAIGGDWETVSALVLDETKDINLNCPNENGQTALFYLSARGEGNVNLLKLMLERGANPNIQDVDGWTSLMKAADAGHREIIEVTLQRQCEINLQENVNGWSALHIAANKGQMDVVKTLIERTSKIDIMLKDKDGKTALQLAQERGHIAVVDLLKSDHDSDEVLRTAELSFNYLEGQFFDLLTEACSELELKNNTFSLKKDKQLPQPILRTHHSYMTTTILSKSVPNLMVFIRHLHLYSWNFFEYEMLEFLIERKCSETLKVKMANFTKEVNQYQQETKLTEVIECRYWVLKTKSTPPYYKDMITEHNIDPNECTLFDLENFRKELHRSLSIEPGCALQMYSIQRTKDRIVVQWIFPEELMDKFFYAEYQGVMVHHEVDKLKIEGMSSHSLSLLRAVREGDMNEVKSMLEDADLEIDVNCCDHNTGCTPIKFAAQQGNLEITEILFSKGANVNIMDKSGRTALMAAVEGGHKEVVQVLLDLETKHICDTNIQEKVLGWTALHFATEKRWGGIVELLIDPILQTDFLVKDKDGRTAIQIAEDKGFTDMVELLSHSGAVTDSEGDDGKLPKIRLPIQWPSLTRNKLVLAAKRGSIADVKKLLEKGEDPNSCDKRKWTPLLHASHNGHEEIVRVLLEKRADPNWRSADGGYTALILASYRGFVEILELLLRHKADVNIQAKNGSTALQLVCLYSPFREKGDKFPTKRRCEVVRLLLRYGADITLADKLDRTPLIAASGSGFSDVVKILLEKIKDFSDKDKEAYLDYVMDRSWTALMKASEIGDVNIVKMLIGAGASLKVKAESRVQDQKPESVDAVTIASYETQHQHIDATYNSDGVTALHIAVYNKHPAVAKVLAKKRDPDVINACDRYGNTSLILATKARDEEAIAVLLEAKADMNFQTKDGNQMTALMFAVKHGYFDIIQMFVKNKADLLIKDKNQRTAGDMAKSKALRRYLYEQEQKSQQLQTAV